MKIISYILSPFFAFTFILFLVIFHPIQWISLNLFGHKAHAWVVAILNFFLVKSMLIMGILVFYRKRFDIPKNVPVIFVSNHQSTFDIPPLNWFFRKHYPKFVAKIELGKGIPSVSFNLRRGGAALIDRKDPKQSIGAIIDFAKRINKNNWSAIIFPEGTRSRNGEPKKFATSGLKVIAKYNKNGFVVPVTINNSWKVFKYGKFPLGAGSPIKIISHEPIKVNSLPFDELIEKVESEIKAYIQ